MISPLKRTSFRLSSTASLFLDHYGDGIKLGYPDLKIPQKVDRICRYGERTWKFQFGVLYLALKLTEEISERELRDWLNFNKHEVEDYR